MERTILIAEDSPTQAEHLRLLLEGEGYRVECARNGREGLERVEHAPPDLIISDVTMPEMDGYAFCQAVKGSDRLRRIPFVLLTGRSATTDILTGFERGADNFITKPFEDDALLERVRRIFDTLELRRRGRLDVEVSLSVAGRQIVVNADKQQMIELLFATLEDLVRTNARLEAQEAHTRSLIESNMDVLITTDPRGVVTDVNARMGEVTGSGRPALLATAFRDHFVDGERADAAIRRVLAEGRLRDYELVLRRDHGGELTVSCNATAIRGVEGEVRGVLVAARDVSEQKRLEAQLRRKNEELEAQNRRVQEANRLKSEFLANMSHELRTPLNGIIGFTELMHDGKLGPITDEQLEYLGDILTSSRHLLQLINDVLDLAKVEAGKMEFHPEPIDPFALVVEVTDILRTLAAQKRIGVATEIDPALGGIVTDAGKLKQVLYNFLSNALKFTRDGGAVKVRVEAEGPEAFRVEVEDTGIGIAAGDVGKLFCEFQQLDAGLTKRHAGTGLGLALTKRIVEAQGGRVGVRSTPGVGSVFFAVLPRAARVVQADDRPGLPPSRDHDAAPVVLVVEDDRQDRSWLTAVLTTAGYSVETAATGAEALARVRGRVFDAITLDLLLPDLHGRDVLRGIREDSLNHATPVIIVTVVADRGIAAGFAVHDVLAKPLSARDLLASLQSADVTPNRGDRVLVVDDDPRALRLAERTLRKLGYDPICRSDAEQGLATAADVNPAAVVLDLLMPGIDGFEFLRRFRKSPQGRRTPVIVWTMKDLTRAERTKLRTTAHAVVAKAKGSAALLEELRQYVPRPLAGRP